MTTVSLPPTQAALIDRLEVQEQKYNEATAMIERLGSAQSLSNPAHQKDLLSLQALLSEIRAAAGEVTSAVADYTAAGHSRSPQLQQALDRQESHLKQFVTRIDGLQNAFSGCRLDMQHQLDSKATRRSMHQAYRQSMKTN